MTDISTAPKDRRILAYGIVSPESAPGWGTVKWNATYRVWNLDPTEASEYDPESCDIWHWQDLPDTPEIFRISKPRAPK